MSTQRVRLLLDARRWDEAVKALHPVVAADPTAPEPWCLLAQAHLGAQRWTDAVDAARRAVALAPEMPWALRLLALGLHNAGRDSEALELVRRLPSLAPDEWRSWWVLSVVARGLGTPTRQEALWAGSRAVALAPEQAEAHDAIAAAELAAGLLPEAEASFRRALALDPTDSYAHNGLGQLALRRHDPATAADGFRRALAADPRASAAQRNLDVALRASVKPYMLTVWVLALALHFVVTDPTVELGALRTTAGIGTVVCVGVLVWSLRRFVGRLPPDLRRFFAGRLRADRELAAGLVLLLAPVPLLAGIVVVTTQKVDSALSALAFVAVLVGRILLFKGNAFRWRWGHRNG